MLFDSHCHLNFSSFKDDYQEVIADSLKKEIGIINIGSQINTSKRAVEIANEYPDIPVYASIGLHPIHLSSTEVDEEEIKFKSREEKFNEKEYQDLIDNDKKNVETRFIASPKIVAVGEIGLDFWHIPEGMNLDEIKQKQTTGFKEQLEFAAKNNLPVILHARGSKNNPEDAYQDILKILKDLEPVPRSISRILGSEGGSGAGVIHCFGSSKEIAQKFLDLGFYIGFTGIITFKNKSVNSLRQVVKFVPLDRILVETDAPYLAPEPHRGERNLPQYVEFVARQVANIKKISYNEVAEMTTQNVKKLFNLNGF